jgi:pimeloyl-ACP methyl ester carboxylesterase
MLRPGGIVTEVATTDHDVRTDGATIRWCELGDPAGRAVLHYHGTPGSRLEMAWADDDLRRLGVRIVAFDRPGYGGSTQTPFSLTSGARMGLAVADAAGLDRFATTGWSGGGPFALATAAVAPLRVAAVGVMSGAGPFQKIPGALEGLEGPDVEAVTYLLTDPERAAALFASGFPPPGAFPDGPAVAAVFGEAMSPRDQQVLTDDRLAGVLAADLREALRQGTGLGGGWDNVAWVGDWDFDLAGVTCPAFLWYGDEDRMAAPVHAEYLAANLPDARLTLRPGIGHLGPFEFLPDMLDELFSGG